MQHNYLKNSIFGCILALSALLSAQSADSTQKDSLPTVKFQKELIAHTGDLLTCAFSPNQKWIATAGWDKKVKLISMDSSYLGAVLKTFEGNQTAINKVTFSPNSELIASAGKDNTTNVWDVNSGESLLNTYENTNEITNIIFDPSSKFIITSSKDGSLIIYDIYNHQNNVPPKAIKYNGEINDFQIIKSGKTFAIASAKKNIEVIDFKGRVIMELIGHQGQINDLAFSPSMRKLASASDDNDVIIWNMATKAILLTLKGHDWHVNSVYWSFDERYLLSTGTHGETILWDAQKGTEITRFQNKITDARDAIISQDLKSIAVVGKTNENLKGAELYSTNLEKVKPRIKGKSKKQMTPKPTKNK